MAEDKLECSEELGDLLQQVDSIQHLKPEPSEPHVTSYLKTHTPSP